MFSHITNFVIKDDSDLMDFLQIQKNLPNFCLNNVENIIDMRPATKVAEIFRLFKQIQSLKCNFLVALRSDGINDGDLTSNSLKFITIKNLHCASISHILFPNIMNVKIHSLKYVDDKWQTFLQNVNNAKLIVIESLICSEDFTEVVRDLIARAKPFKIRHCKDMTKISDIDEDEIVGHNIPFYKILVYEKDKIIKVSNYIMQNCEWIVTRLNESFAGYQIIVFCFDRPHEHLNDWIVVAGSYYDHE